VSDEIEVLARLLAKLPGLGVKSGARLAYFIWKAPGTFSEDLAKAITAVRQNIQECEVCKNPTASQPCRICADPDRERESVIVVEVPQDLSAIEKTGGYKGLYHVLGGTLSPLAGKTADDINISSLLERAASKEIKEIIIATNPSAEGDATASYIEEALEAEAPSVRVTRLARGIPVGSEIKYMDPVSLGHALKGRTGRE